MSAVANNSTVADKSVVADKLKTGKKADLHTSAIPDSVEKANTHAFDSTAVTTHIAIVVPTELAAADNFVTNPFDMQVANLLDMQVAYSLHLHTADSVSSYNTTVTDTHISGENQQLADMLHGNISVITHIYNSTPVSMNGSDNVHPENDDIDEHANLTYLSHNSPTNLY